MRGDRLLAIDVGTQSVRALAFDPQGVVVDRARVPFDPPYRSQRPGWAEQDPEFYWERTVEACRLLWQQGRVRPGELAGVALTTQRSTVVNLDEGGRPLRPAIVWPDQRRADQVPAVGPKWRLLFTLAGLTQTLAYLQAEAEANWIRLHQPDVWKRTAHFLLLSGYLTYRLVGRFVDSVASQVGYLPFDYRHRRWAGPRDWRWEAVAVRPGTLPDLVEPGRVLGEVQGEAHEATGLPKGLPVVAAASDKACEVLGCGCLEPHKGCIGYGTTATISVTSQRYVEPIRLIPPYPSALPGAYNLEVQVYRGFWLVSWFVNEFAALERAAAAREGVSVESLLDRQAAEVPPGSLGLIAQPFWTPGLRLPGPEARGAVVGWTAAHGRSHLYRALLEGLAYAMREGKERIEARTGSPLREVHVAGGGARSDLAVQIAADVLRLPAVRPAVWEASGLGAAMLAAAGTGVHGTVEQAAAAMAHPGQRFEPREQVSGVYDELYRQAYRPLYGQLRPLYRALARLRTT